MHNPLEQFEVVPLFSTNTMAGPLTLTNSGLFMLVAVLAVTLFFLAATRKKALVPGRMQSLAESMYEFIGTMIDENIGTKGRKYFPFVLTLFLFILFMNLIGMVPYSFTPTSHIIVTFGMSLVVFLGVTLVAIITQGPVKFFKHFIPDGMPVVLIPIILLIELVSYMARPFSLAIRLAANMIAGHTLLKVIAGFVIPLGIFGIAPLLFSTFMIGFEIFIAILQAYVFALLSTIYLSEALAEHH
ncbi:MAG: F0F1 ATP synthase subunit A [Rickettsiales bacterium]